MKTEIEISLAELKSALRGFSKIIPRKPSLPILGCVKLSLDDENELIRVEATNLDEFIQFRLQSDGESFSGSIIIPFEDLAKVVKGCPSKGTIRVIAEKEKTIIRYPLGGGFVDQQVERLEEKEWPAVVTVDSEPITLSDDFKETLRQAIECASTDSSRYVLNGACLDVSYPSGHYVVGTDGRHLFSANSFHFQLDASVIIPGKRFLTWDGFTGDGSWYLRTARSNEGGPWLRIDSERWSYIAKQIDAAYPNWKQVIPALDGNWTKLVISESAAQMMLGAIPMLPGAKEHNEPIDLLVGMNGLVIRGRSKNGRVSEAKIEDVEIIGKPVAVSVNRIYLLKALRLGFRDINIENPVNALVFLNGGKKLVVMPLRGEAADNWSADHPPTDSSPASTTAQPPSGEACARPEGPAENPSPAEPTKPETEERKPMEPTMKSPQRGNLKSHTPDSNAEAAAIDELNEQIEKTRTQLREVFTSLNELANTARKVSKEQKNTEKEINRVRALQRSLQSVEI